MSRSEDNVRTTARILFTLRRGRCTPSSSGVRAASDARAVSNCFPRRDVARRQWNALLQSECHDRAHWVGRQDSCLVRLCALGGHASRVFESRDACTRLQHRALLRARLPAGLHQGRGRPGALRPEGRSTIVNWPPQQASTSSSDGRFAVGPSWGTCTARSAQGACSGRSICGRIAYRYT